MRDRDHRCRSWACAVLVAAALVLPRCRPAGSEPVAPFGGALATPLPYPDVLGFARFRIGDALAEELAASLGDATIATKIGFFGPTAKVIEMLGREPTRFVGADDSFVVFLLDASVHGAFAAFAWRGDSTRFRAAARLSGVPIAGDRVELPGMGRGTLRDVTLDSFRRHAAGDGELADEVRGLPDRVAYHLIERDGVTLLAPARDGARNLLSTLEATGALAPGSDADAFVRLDLGRVLRQLRDEFRNQASDTVADLIERLTGQVGVRRVDDREGYWKLRRNAMNLVDGALDLICSVDHLCARWQEGRLDLYLHAEERSFLERVLTVAQNRPTRELVAGAPTDANAVVAFAVDPTAVADVPRRWRASQNDWFRRMRVDLPDVAVSGEDEGTPFLASFAGRAWLAATTLPAEDETEDPTVSLRTFAEFKDDASDQSLVEAMLDALLPDSWMKMVRTASIVAFRHQRVSGGVIEAIGTQPGNVIAREARRLADPEPFAIPWDGPESAFLFARVHDPVEPEPATVTLTRDGHGIHAVVVLPLP